MQQNFSLVADIARGGENDAFGLETVLAFSRAFVAMLGQRTT